jgi:hypothetical protein
MKKKLLFPLMICFLCFLTGCSSTTKEDNNETEDRLVDSETSYSTQADVYEIFDSSNSDANTNVFSDEKEDTTQSNMNDSYSNDLSLKENPIASSTSINVFIYLYKSSGMWYNIYS